MTLVNMEATVLFCTKCQQVVCPYCYFDEDGELVESNLCQGHIGGCTDECDHEVE